ncbi:hypothetical protein MTO96_014538 [Rhipicephalus appendiculatus]
MISQVPRNGVKDRATKLNLSKHVLGMKSLPYLWSARSIAAGHATHTCDSSHQESRGRHVDKCCMSRQRAFYLCLSSASRKSICERCDGRETMSCGICMFLSVQMSAFVRVHIIHVCVSVYIHCGKKGECMV